MVFSSLIFLFWFLPVVLVLYYCLPRRFRNFILFITSLLFYAWGEPAYIVLMMISTMLDYSFGLLLDRPKLSPRKRKLIVTLSIIANLGILSYFKYVDFLIQNVNALLGTHIHSTELPLPIGISFYTFQSMSYIIDVYRGSARAQRNWVDFGTYVALFPQLVAGPIVQYNTLAVQLKERSENIQMFAEGVRRFIIGLTKKVLLANNIGILWQTISHSNLDSLPALTAWIGIVAFAFQIYFDFSGYSDMAIGLGLMFGFRFRENFNKPYIAESITDFWRRWHISLSSWFRDYVYIPLGGNRRGLAIQMRNILIVWLLTGLWHGASWNFVLWGLYFGVILMIEKWWGLKLLQRLPHWVRHIYAIFLILVGWVLFAFDQPSLIVHYLQAMAGLNHQPIWNDSTVYYAYTNAILLVVLIIASIRKKQPPESSFSLVWYGFLFFLSIAYLVDDTFNPFLYFRF
ncbi:MBOAT family protein [Bacillus sp. S/N-304-OC-R1]|uniref:MBOAT family O-acyltransferase n=1 Tax=Bacillus sp. S/N-304-OC-R1 TaxID=2758034 RepID=UPI001C8E0C17|nr:MBOAT family protein [Bacillus sp. S/N-304-OC-R1]MBY0123571.1 MBOAT family protein [Bacillus sp. S/N-304-OC-R1]